MRSDGWTRARQNAAWCAAACAWLVAMSAWLAHWPAAMGAGLVMLGLSGAVLAWVHVARGGNGHVANGGAVGRVADFGVAAQVADEGDFVDRGHGAFQTRDGWLKRVPFVSPAIIARHLPSAIPRGTPLRVHPDGALGAVPRTVVTCAAYFDFGALQS